MRITFLLVIFFSTFLDAFSQNRDPAEWTYAFEKNSDKSIQLIVGVKLDSGWHIYSSVMEEGGPQKTIININKDPSFKVENPILESGNPVEKLDSNFNIKLRYYPDSVIFRKQIDISSKLPSKVTGSISYMLCTNEICLPPEEHEFSVMVPPLDEIPLAATVSQSGANVINNPVRNTLAGNSFLYIFAMGFLSGLAGLLTPCVSPMIPMTVSFFNKHSRTRTEGLKSAFIYAISIIVIYVTLGFGISKIFGIDALNALSTNVWFNLAFFTLLIIFAASFFGAFEITLPSSLVNKVSSQSAKGGLTGIFFMAFTLSLVSFSCTGPIIGTLLFEAAATGNIGGPLWGMIGFSSAMAFPFGLFAAFPGWLHALPKSGGWLNTVKVSLGFVELALALKFLSNADLVVQANVITREIFLVLWIIILTLWGLYLLGKIRFAQDKVVTHLSVPRLALIIITFSLALYLMPGLWGAPLKLVSGFPPPDFYSEWKQPASLTNPITQASSPAGNEHCPNNLKCFHDYDEGIAYARKVNKPLLLDFTGWACVNCRKMENLVWTDPEIDAKIRNDVVLVSLYVDDKRSLPENEKTKKNLGNKSYNINTVGSKWSFFQASRFNINSQPYYAMLDTAGNTLSISAGYSTNVSAYNEFLDEGLEKFKKRIK